MAKVKVTIVGHYEAHDPEVYAGDLSESNIIATDKPYFDSDMYSALEMVNIESVDLEVVDG